MDEKFAKLKDVYAKLREEHIQLIRQVIYGFAAFFMNILYFSLPFHSIFKFFPDEVSRPFCY